MKDPTNHLKKYGADIASSVSPARSQVAAMRAIGRAGQAPRRRTPQIAFAVAGGFLALNFATASVANAAVPGDLLYPLDRGYEKVGSLFGIDHTEERLDEAEVLVQRRDLDGAAALVAEASGSDAVDDIADALASADTSDATLIALVGNLVTSARDLVHAREGEDPTRLAEARAALELAAAQVDTEVPRGAGADDANRPEHAGETGPPDHAGEPGPPDHAQTPDQSGDPGPPEDVQPPGQSGETGPPDQAQPRDDPQPPDNSQGPDESIEPPARGGDRGNSGASEGNQGNQSNQGNPSGPPSSNRGQGGR